MQQGTTLPGVETGDDEERIVVHVDLDCFYAACERLREPALEGEPVVVGMGYEAGQPDGAVATASYEARKHGVESAQAISTALERLPRVATAEREDEEQSEEEEEEEEPDSAAADGDPDEPLGHYRPVDMSYYESTAADVKEILHDCAETVREVSIDEAYLDVTERTDWSVVEGFARHVKQRIDREVGLTASVGVAPTMHAAKVASDHDKPDGLVVVEPGEVASFLAPLPIDELHGIGPVTARTLREHGIETVADLADADREWVVEQWGDRGGELHERARGVDPRNVEPRGRPKSLSRESSFGDPEDDYAAVEERIRALGEAVADRARSKAALYRTIGIKVVLPPFDVNTRARSLPGPVDDPDLVEEVALDLLTEFDDETPRKVGVRVSNLSFADADQSTLGGWDGEQSADGLDANASETAVGNGADGTAGIVDADDTGGALGTDDTSGTVGTDDATGGPGSDDITGTLGTANDEEPDVPDLTSYSDGAGSSSADPSAESTTAQERSAEQLSETPSSEAQPDGDRREEAVHTDDLPGQSVLDRVWSDGPAEHADPEPIGQPPDQTTLSEFD